MCIVLEACLAAYRCIKGEPAIEEYYEIYAEAEEYSNKISEVVMQSPAALQSLSLGRVVVVKSQLVSSLLQYVSFTDKYNADFIFLTTLTF